MKDQFKTEDRTREIIPQKEQEQYLTEKQTAEITKEALATLRNKRHLRRGLPYFKVGGGRAIRYRLSDIVAYMERLRIDPEV